jgi:hypothetical protein
LTFQWGCGNYSGFGDGGAWDNEGIGDNEPLEILHPCTCCPLFSRLARICLLAEFLWVWDKHLVRLQPRVSFLLLPVCADEKAPVTFL